LLTIYSIENLLALIPIAISSNPSESHVHGTLPESNIQLNNLT
jgi:hypothetical protein